MPEPQSLEEWATYCHSIHSVPNAPMLCLNCARAYGEQQTEQFRLFIEEVATTMRWEGRRALPFVACDHS